MGSLESKQFSSDTSVSRLVGSSSEQNDNLLIMIKREKDRFDEYLTMGMQEKDKTPEDLELIAFADNVSSNIIRAYDGDFSKKIPLEKIHIRNEDITAGCFVSQADSIDIAKRDYSPLSITRSLIHEMIHYKAFNSVTVKHNKDSEKLFTSDRRRGLTIYTKEGQRYFQNINEAITEELVKRYYLDHEDDFLNSPLLHDDVQRIIDCRNRYTDVHNGVFGIRECDAEYWENKYQTRYEISGFTESGGILGCGYVEEREVLMDYIDNLVKNQKSPDNSLDEKNIFDLFARAAINGNILPLARLINEIEGPNGFKELGEKTKWVNNFAAKENIVPEIATENLSRKRISSSAIQKILSHFTNFNK